jgi:hypothetical protein
LFIVFIYFYYFLFFKGERNVKEKKEGRENKFFVKNKEANKKRVWPIVSAIRDLQQALL